MRYALTLLAALALSALAYADGSATCYMGAYQRTYTVIGDPDVDEGVISMQIDSGLWAAETSPCLLDLDPDYLVEDAKAPKVSPSVVFCYDPHTGAEVLRHSTVALMSEVEGVVTWQRHDDSRRFYATLPCRELRGQP